MTGERAEPTRATPGDKQHRVAAAGDQFSDFGVVVDIGEAKPDFAVGNHVEQIEAAAWRNIAWFDETRDRRGA